MCRQDVCEREDLSDGCGVSAPSSILFGYLLLTCIEHLDGGVPSEHSCWVFSVADCSPGSPYVTYCSLGGSRTSKAWICGSCSNWLHLEVSFSVLTTSYEVSIRQVYLYAFMLWNCKKKTKQKQKTTHTHTRIRCYNFPGNICRPCVSQRWLQAQDCPFSPTIWSRKNTDTGPPVYMFIEQIKEGFLVVAE